ncbi:MAG TPA: hypothetical protein VHN79_14185 [Lacunisphaera sp.]|nr:hypothetical protein [Lacunisphaera sp.]
MMNLLRLPLAVGILALTARAQQEPTPSWLEGLHLTASGNVSFVDNISRTSDPATRKDAATYDLSLTSSHPRQLSRNLLLVATAEAEALHVPKYDLTDHQRLSGRVSLQSKIGLGPQATVLQLRVGATYKAARFAADRGWTTDADLQIAKRVLPNLRLAARAGLLEHTARSATFDLNQRSFSVEAQWDINQHWTLSGSAGRVSGDIVANAAWPVWATLLAGGFGPTVFDYYTSRPWNVTHLYGPDWVSYNVEADVDQWSVAIACAIGDRTSLELRKGGAYVVNRAGVTYPIDSWNLAVAHRF